jgi:protein-S-isoprenylcysteine O-methyltransferase Ste14
MIIAIYLPIGIIFEEQKLVKEYGDRYKKYQKEVPMLIPKI